MERILGSLRWRPADPVIPKFIEKQVREMRYREMTSGLFRFMLTGVLLASLGPSWATTLDGTWRLERSADYYGRGRPDRLNRFDTLVIKNGDIGLSPDCLVHFGPENYDFSDVFQPLVKADITEKQVDAFLSNKFGLTLSRTKTVYALANPPSTCARPMMEFFQVGERILVPVGATFYSYVKVTGDDAARSATSREPYSWRATNFDASQ